MPGRRTVWISYDSKGCACMEASAQVGAEVVGVVTLSREARAHVISPGDFEPAAARLGAQLIETRHVNRPECVEAVRRLDPDVIFVVGWSQLLGREMIGLARTGVFNIHPTMLPKHRGRAPVPWTILSGLARTAVTLHEIDDERADAGPVVGQVEVRVDPRETATTLYAKFEQAHLDLVRAWLPLVFTGEAPRTPQDDRRSSWWTRRDPADALIDWDMRAARVDEWVRAHTHPFSGAFTWLGEHRLTIWGADFLAGGAPGGCSGTLSYAGGEARVECGDGVLLVQEAELDGVPLGPADWAALVNGGALLG